MERLERNYELFRILHPQSTVKGNYLASPSFAAFGGERGGASVFWFFAGFARKKSKNTRPKGFLSQTIQTSKTDTVKDSKSRFFGSLTQQGAALRWKLLEPKIVRNKWPIC